MKKSIFSAATMVFLVMLTAGSVHATPVPDTTTTSVMLAPIVLVLGAISRFIKR